MPVDCPSVLLGHQGDWAALGCMSDWPREGKRLPVPGHGTVIGDECQSKDAQRSSDGIGEYRKKDRPPQMHDESRTDGAEKYRRGEEDDGH